MPPLHTDVEVVTNVEVVEEFFNVKVVELFVEAEQFVVSEFFNIEVDAEFYDAEVEVRLWMEQLSIMSKVNEMALEVSTVNKVNEVALEVSNVNEESNVNEVNVSEVNMNEVNDESTVNEACCIARNIKEVAPGVVPYSMIKEVELHMAHNVQVESGAEVQVEQNGAKVQVEQNGDKFDEVKSDVNVEAKVEVFGIKEVKNLKDDNKVEVFDAEVNNGKVRLRLISKKAEVEQSRPAKWDPGQLFGAKDQMEMLNVEEAEILVNINKVGLQLFMKEVWSSGGAIEKALLIVMFLLKERFVNSFNPLSVIELSDYG